MPPDELAGLLAQEVETALDLPEADRRAALNAVAGAAYALAVDELGFPLTQSNEARFRASLASMIDATEPDGSPEQADRIAHIVATAALNAANVFESAPGTLLTWRTTGDDRVRELHREMDGRSVTAGTPFVLDGHALLYPGQPVGPPEIWINCRCHAAMNVTAAASSTTTAVDTSAAVAVAAADDQPKGIVLVAVPGEAESLVVADGLPQDELHVTLGYFGKTDEVDADLRPSLESFMADLGGRPPFTARVSGVARLGDDDPQATALLIESPALQELRNALAANYAPPDATHPHFTPHLTLGYGVDLPGETPSEITLDHIELWWGEERMTASHIAQPVTAAVSDKSWSQFSASDYTLEQWRRATLIKMPDGDPDAKSTYKLPVREPDGTLNRNAVHAAAAALAGARGGVDAPASQKEAARKKLRSLYREMDEDPPESLSAATDSLVAQNTRDAPGWLTHPRETQRLRTYWTRGAGAAKIRWGTPGDLTRCVRNLRKYVGPQHVWGTCQNLHHAALGYFNPESRGASLAADLDIDTNEESAEFMAVTEAFQSADRLVAAAGADEDESLVPPREWFEDPQLEGPTPLQVQGDRVVGHLATWDTCHVGFEGSCRKPPHSKYDYAYFRTGEVTTAGGPVPVGQITMDTGHAGSDMNPGDTVRHYDDTGTVVADVAAGEDEYGIWVAGTLRPGVSDEQRRALAAGALSGDWRRIGGNLELVAALVVNVPGFPIPRPELVASGEMELSLVASNIVPQYPADDAMANRLADAVVATLERREAERRRAERAAALRSSAKKARVEAIVAAAGGGDAYDAG